MAVAVISFVIFSFIAWMEVRETADLLVIRMVFTYCPAILTLVLMGRTLSDIMKEMYNMSLSVIS
jgi:hypothetical protein